MNEEQRNNLADKLCDCMTMMQMQLVAIDATSVISSCEFQYKLFKDFMEIAWNQNQKIVANLDEAIFQLLGGDD